MIKERLILAFILTLLIIIVLTVGCIENNEEPNGNDISSVLLTINFGDYQVNYTLEDIEMLEAYSGTGGYIKTKLLPDSILISDILEYTGVRLHTLLDEIPNIPDRYNVIVISDDGYTTNYSMNKTLGYVNVFNENGDIIPKEPTVMILAYKEDGLFYSEIDPKNEIGPLRIAFVGDNVITSSNLWSRKVVSIHINKI